MNKYDIYGEELTYRHGLFLDLDGQEVKRTPFSHPYNYDEYVTWKSDDFNKERCHAVYSDRLYQWDHKKYSKCCQEVFKNEGQAFDSRNPATIERFLGMYLDKEIKLAAIMQGCNQSSGFPYWIFFYEVL